MGDAADLILEGHICQTCGEFIDDGEACGYPRNCRGCGGDPNKNYVAIPKPRPKPFKCKECGKRFRTEDGMWDHDRDVHSN